MNIWSGLGLLRVWQGACLAGPLVPLHECRARVLGAVQCAIDRGWVRRDGVCSLPPMGDRALMAQLTAGHRHDLVRQRHEDTTVAVTIVQ
jgi:hypothetical protein